MSYLDKNLVPDEVVLFRTKKHLIIFVLPLVWTIIAIIASVYMLSTPLLSKLTFIPWVVALVFWGYVWLEYFTSEFAVTNKRVMMREGFFTRHSNEVRLTAISQVNVDQSLLGQILNYGIVSINAFGAFDAYTLISQPFTFQKVINEQTDKLLK